MKNNKLKIISAAIVALTVSSAANAQWATINVQDFLNRMFQSAGSNGIKGAVDMSKAAIDNLARQNAENQSDTNARNNKTQAEILARDKITPSVPQMPSIEQCIEITKVEAKAPAVAAAAKGGGGGSQGAGPGGSRTNVKTTSEALAKTLDQKVALGTCSPEVQGAANCGAGGTYSGADIHPKGVKGNSEGSTSSPTESEYKNYSLNSDGFKVAQKYASDMSLFDKPKVATPTQLAKNQGYAAYYAAMESKLEAAHDAVLDIAKVKREGPVPAGIAGQQWQQATDYSKVTGLKTKPSQPSIYDIVNYSVMKDYVGNSDADLSSVEESNKRLALSNFIAWKAYQQQENTNILLSHILVQLTTPISKSQVDAEYSKTVNAK
jgi:hypothetical protein